MPQQNSVFHTILKHLAWAAFEEIVKKHGADADERGFDTRTQLTALLYGQLSGAGGLREIVAGLESHERQRYPLRISKVRRSTFAEANARRPSAVFAELLAVMMAQGQRGLRKTMKGVTYLVDSSPLRLSGRSAGWARFSAKVCGAKMHVVYDPDADQPVYAAVSAANVNDITIAQAMPIEPGASYVFDLGYYDYGWWAELDAQGCRIVTRIKRNTPLSVIEERAVAPGSNILCDRVGYLPARQANSRKNPFDKPVREVQVKIETGKILRILSNDLELPAERIAELYKQRWAIELFFRWVKQTLKITRFLGTSENAIRTQIAVALIAFILLRLAQATQSAVTSSLTFARLVRANLMHRRDLRFLSSPETPRLPNPNQLVLV